MLYYENPSGANTPFIPPLPSPDSVVQPPPIPTPDHREAPSWTQQPRSPAHYPFYPSSPYNATPFIPPMPSVHSTPASQLRPEPPGSYYPAPSALPVSPGMPQTPYSAAQGPSGIQVSADFTGYPTSLQGTPWAPPPPMPPPNAMPAPPWSAQPPPPNAMPAPPWSAQPPPPNAMPAPPWSTQPPPMPPPNAMPWPAQPPPTGYNGFNQPLPGAMWPSMPPHMMGSYTPAAGAWPMHLGMSPHPAYAGAYTPWQHPTQQPPPIRIPGNPADTAQAAFRWSSNADHVDFFAEGSHYGPVLEPFLAKIVGAVIKVNPLLAPPSDVQDDYLRWNMLFHTSNCYRTTESQRSWVKGRNAPATHPRMTHVRIICRAFPWMIQARAHNPKLGVTCGEVLDAVSAYMYGDVAKKEYENLAPGKKRHIWESYKFNRSTDLNAPGGRLGEGLKRLDWLGSASRFGGLVVNDTFVKEHCGDGLPCTFELKCLPSYPLTAEELREQQRRLENNPPRHRSRSRHASSGQPSPRSATVRTASENEEEEEEYENIS